MSLFHAIGLIGLEVIALSLAFGSLPPGLLARWISVGVLITVMRAFHVFTRHSVKMMTWGGLRGRISVALALSPPDLPGRVTIVAATYGVVMFNIRAQALRMGPLVRWLARDPKPS